MRLELQFFGGRGAGSGKKGSAGGAGGGTQTQAQTPQKKGEYPETEVTTQDGTKLDLSRFPLVYGDNDPAISGATRTAIEAQEKQRLSAKIEYARVVDANGDTIGTELKGGKGSVKLPGRLTRNPNAVSVTHNHPRGKGEEGVLGGTFSDADLYRFAGDPFPNIRASAAEGTYSMTKGPKFDVAGFQRFVAKTNAYRKGQHRAYKKQIESDYYSGKISYNQYKALAKESFNRFLINVHNDYLAHQDKYGYSYTLERRQ